MAISRKVERELIREKYLTELIEFLNAKGEEVLRVKSNEIAIPVVGCEDNEDFLVVTVKVPTGANKGQEPYDGYAEAEDYALKLKQKEEKAKVDAEKKAKKIAKDKAIREKKKEIAEKSEQSKGRTNVRPILYPKNEHTFDGPGATVKKLTKIFIKKWLTNRQ